MIYKQLPLFKDLAPYSGNIDKNNRWIRMAELVPWEPMAVIYVQYFDPKKLGVIKSNRLILGLLIGQMLLKLSDRGILTYFHENPYFQYFCGQDTFIPKLDGKTIIHESLLSKRRKRLGKRYIQAFEKEVLTMLKKSGLITRDKLMLDATVIPSNITYPNDIKLLNTAREWCCQTILKIKKVVAPRQRIRTYRKVARQGYLAYQKTKKKGVKLIRRTKKKMCHFLKRNMSQLETLLKVYLESVANKGPVFATENIQRIQSYLATAKEIYTQQFDMLTTKGRRVKDRIVSLHQPLVRPIVRGKDGKRVEFGAKLHVALVDGFGFLDDCSFEAYHEGIRLFSSLEKHKDRFGQYPKTVLADQLYATRDNRKLLDSKHIKHGFKPLGRPPSHPDASYKTETKRRRKQQRLRNHIEGLFGTLKSSVKLDKITWTIPDGPIIQSSLALTSRNLYVALHRT